MRRTGALAAIAAAQAWALVLAPGAARAADVGSLGGAPLKLDATDTSIVAQHFDYRSCSLPVLQQSGAYVNQSLPCEKPQDSGWGQWLNRLNAALRWENWTVGLRLDSVVYWRRPYEQNPNYNSLPVGGAYGQNAVAVDNESRYTSSIYPAKLWATYTAPGIEITAGDSYVQFGHGLTLSMRKIDELGIDTTVRGGKIQLTKDPVQLTFVAGFGNPSRVDEATGRSLFPTHDPVMTDVVMPVFGSDRIIGGEIQEGRGLPVVLATHAVQFTRCAPYHYDSQGHIVTDFFSDPSDVAFGTCNDADTRAWLSSLPTIPPTINAHTITLAGQSVELPDLWGHGKLYVEGAVQQSQHELAAQNLTPNGNALYGALSVDFGPETTTVELKSNRNFYAVPASVNTTVAPEFNVVTYTFIPPAESMNMLDTEFGNFNACINAVRLKEDVNLTDHLMAYAQGIYAYSQSEQLNGGCDAMGHTVSTFPSNQVEDRVYDGLTGLEYYFDDNASHIYFSTGARKDDRASGQWYYDEAHAEYSIAKYVGGPWSVEMQGWHRLRREANQNADPVTLVERWWNEGENYVAVKLAPKWVFSQGFEYTTLQGQPLTYFNGSVLYRFAAGSNVRLFVGQQRGAFRCASGVCRYFPPFEGARAELTLRF
jgi:hypothetical protein